MKIRPKKFDLNLIFECSICKSEHWFTTSEAKAGNVFFCCGHQYEIEPAAKITVGVKYNDKPSTNKNTDAIDILKEYGFTEKEIVESNIQSEDTQTFVRLFLASRQNESASNNS